MGDGDGLSEGGGELGLVGMHVSVAFALLVEGGEARAGFFYNFFRLFFFF